MVAVAVEPGCRSLLCPLLTVEGDAGGKGPSGRDARFLVDDDADRGRSVLIPLVVGVAAASTLVVMAVAISGTVRPDIASPTGAVQEWVSPGLREWLLSSVLGHTPPYDGTDTDEAEQPDAREQAVGRPDADRLDEREDAGRRACRGKVAQAVVDCDDFGRAGLCPGRAASTVG